MELWSGAQVPHLFLKPLEDQPLRGPDGMAYLAVEVGEGEAALDILNWLGEKGVGLVVNPQKDPPDGVFSYGMIWNFLLHGEFLSPPEALKKPLPRESSYTKISPGSAMRAGPPSESYFPLPVRKIFKEFMDQQKVPDPRVLMLSMDGENYDLCFSLESLGSPPPEEWEGILETFSWFFPRHYSLSAVSEKSIEGAEFIRL